MADDTPETTLPEPGADDVLYVLDLSGYVFRAYHAIPPLSNSKGEPTHAVHGFTAMLLKLVQQQKPARFAVAMDSKGPSFRKEMFEAYKANRPAPPPDLSQQIERCKQIVDAYEIPCFSVQGTEADDLIATLVGKAREEGLRVVIVSSDKDLMQLVGDDVMMLDTVRNNVYGPAEATKKMGVPPAQIRDLLALTGDSSDNVPGVPSVGPKTAQKLLEEYGDLDGIYAHVDEIKRKNTREKLHEHRADAYLSQELVTLKSDVPLDFDLDALKWSGGDESKLRELFLELEFHRLLNQLSPESAPKAAGDYRTVSDEAALGELVEALRDAGAFALFTALEGNDPVEGELCGLGFAYDSDAAYYVPFGHRYLGVPDQVPLERALSMLRPLLESAEYRKWSQDLKRDEIALGRHGVTLRGGAFDTTIASYLLDAGKHAHDLEDVARVELRQEVLSYDKATDKQRGKQKLFSEITVERGCEYGAQRAAVTWAATEPLRGRIEREGFESLMEDVEIPLAHVLSVMESTGVRIDTDYLGRMSKEVSEELRRLEKRCHELAGEEFNVASPKQLETILFDKLGLRVVKRTKTGRSTDASVLEELAAEHELPHAIVEHRSIAKLKGTYLDALPKQVSKRTGRVHTRYNQAVAATGRLSSSDPNLQNIPIRTELGRKIRDAFIADPGHEVFSADYSQIELRVLAHLSQDPELLEAFQKHEDVHVRTATALFDVKPEDVTREQRGQAKTVNFAVIYGQTHFALARNLGIERREAMRYIEAFFERYAGVKAYMDSVIEEARTSGSVRTILDRRRALPDLHSRNRGLRWAAERIARNTPIQGSAADIMKIAMVRIQQAMEREKMEARMLLTVHDELVFEAPPAEREPLESMVREKMEAAMELSVPLVVDSGWGRTWGDAH